MRKTVLTISLFLFSVGNVVAMEIIVKEEIIVDDFTVIPTGDPKEVKHFIITRLMKTQYPFQKELTQKERIEKKFSVLDGLKKERIQFYENDLKMAQAKFLIDRNVEHLKKLLPFNPKTIGSKIILADKILQLKKADMLEGFLSNLLDDMEVSKNVQSRKKGFFVRLFSFSVPQDGSTSSKEGSMLNETKQKILNLIKENLSRRKEWQIFKPRNII